MFDLSFGELVVVAVLALLVLGPERLPKAARYAGLWVRKARAQWYSVKSEFERELAAEDMKRSIGNPVQDLREDVTGLGRDLAQPVRDVESEARAELDAATAVLPPESPPETRTGAEAAAPAEPRQGAEAASPGETEAGRDEDDTPRAGKPPEPPSA